MKKIVFIFFLSLAMISCSETVIEEIVITEPITYDADVATIISNNCLPCHGGSAPSAGLNLENYTNVRNATENGNVIARINSASNPMPLSGQMAPALIATIEQWAADGYIEN